jgi:hypothetical protein
MSSTFLVALVLLFEWCQCRDSLVALATGYKLDGQGSIPGRYKRFSVLHSVQTDPGAHCASYPVGTGGSFRESKAAGPWSWKLTSVYTIYLHCPLRLHGLVLN